MSAPHDPGVSITLPQTLLRASEIRHTVSTMQPTLEAAFNDQYDYLGLLTTGDELGLWRYLYHETDTPRRFLVEINNQQRWLLEAEVPGWVIGVLDASALPVGPFRYREGL